MIISFILLTLMSDPGVMLKEETSRWSLLDFKELKKIPCSFVTIRLSIEMIYVPSTSPNWLKS